MGKIFCIMGKSSSGKDTLFRLLLEKQELSLNTIVPYTTIPMRAVHGTWKYFTVDDGQVDLAKQSYLIIGTLESYLKIREYYGKKQVIPIYIEVDDGERLARALERERFETVPKYEELCRRFLADAADFSEQKLKEAGIEKRFANVSLEEAEQEITEYILNLKNE